MRKKVKKKSSLFHVTLKQQLIVYKIYRNCTLKLQITQRFLVNFRKTAFELKFNNQTEFRAQTKWFSTRKPLGKHTRLLQNNGPNQFIFCFLWNEVLYFQH